MDSARKKARAAKRKAPRKKYDPAKHKDRKRRYGNKLIRVYWDKHLIAGYFEGEIPSVNELTLDVHKIKRRAPTSQVRIFVQAILSWLQKYEIYMPKFKFFQLDLAVWVPMYSDRGRVLIRDASNFIKISEDSICKALGYDDTFNLDVSVHKRNLLPDQTPHWTFVLIGRNHEQHKDEGNEEAFPAIHFKKAAEEGKGWQPQSKVYGKR